MALGWYGPGRTILEPEIYYIHARLSLTLSAPQVPPWGCLVLLIGRGGVARGWAVGRSESHWEPLGAALGLSRCLPMSVPCAWLCAVPVQPCGYPCGWLWVGWARCRIASFGATVPGTGGHCWVLLGTTGRPCAGY